MVRSWIGKVDWYDYGARHYDAAIGRWCVVDPSGEKYYNWTLYGYCKSNPVLRIDLDGKDDYVINNRGRVRLEFVNKNSFDRLRKYGSEKSIIVADKKILKDIRNVQKEDIGRGIECYVSTKSLSDAASVFKFAAENTDVEWRLDLYEDGEDKTAAIGTSGKTNQVLSDSSIKGNKVFDLHSHPDNAYASENDMQLLDPGSKGAIYHVKTKELIFYDKKHAHIEGQNYQIETSKDLLRRLIDSLTEMLKK